MVHYISRGHRLNFPNDKCTSFSEDCVLANSVEPDEMPRYAAFHLRLHCLPNDTFRSHQSRGRGRDNSDIFIHKMGHFFGFKILNFHFVLGFQKNEYFLGYDDFVDIFLGSSKNWTFLCILGSFFKANVQNGGSFFLLLKFQIIVFWYLKFLIFLRTNSR